jgi:hypothetical protein
MEVGKQLHASAVLAARERAPRTGLGAYEKGNISLPLPGIRTQFLGFPVVSLVIISNTSFGPHSV